MNRRSINEIQQFRKLSGLIKEDLSKYSELFNDIKKLITISSPEMKQKKEYQDLIDFFKDLMPSGIDLTSGVIPSETDIAKKASSQVANTVTNDDDFFKEILECVGAPVTRDNMLFFYAWRQAEGGQANNNPFNTTMGHENATPYASNTHGVKNYATIQDGIDATCDTLKLSYYDDITNGMKNDVGLYELSRMESLNKWGNILGATPKPKPIMKGDFKTPEIQNPDLNSPVVK
jgi:hypothetical protein